MHTGNPFGKLMEMPEKKCFKLIPCYMRCVGQTLIRSNYTKYINQTKTECPSTAINATLGQIEDISNKCQIEANK